MKVILHSVVAAPSLVRRYQFAARILREAGVLPEIRTGVSAEVVAEGADVLVSHNWIAESVRQQPALRCYGGKNVTRPDHLALLAALGFPTMEWTTVASQAEALALLDTWGVSLLILKRSFTV